MRAEFSAFLRRCQFAPDPGLGEQHHSLRGVLRLDRGLDIAVTLTVSSDMVPVARAFRRDRPDAGDGQAVGSQDRVLTIITGVSRAGDDEVSAVLMHAAGTIAP